MVNIHKAIKHFYTTDRNKYRGFDTIYTIVVNMLEEVRNFLYTYK